MTSGGTRAVDRCRTLGVAPYSDSLDGLYRGYLTPAHAQALQQVGQWMREAGMAVRIDPAANLVGRYEGLSEGPPLVIGSHIDSVQNGGCFDGPLGIMLGIECVASLAAEGRRMAFPIEIYAFGDEEGSRFPAAMLTSRAVAGNLDPASLAVSDRAGVSLSQALADFGSAQLSEARYPAARHAGALAYLEAHIEQGPVLEAAGLALGTVTGIAAQLRYSVGVAGQAGHAGTTPMDLRRDALAGAAEMVLAAETQAHAAGGGLVATVGKIEARPGAANVIPGSAHFTVDVRAADDQACRDAASAILGRFGEIAGRRGLSVNHEVLQDLPAAHCDTGLSDMLEAAIGGLGQPAKRLLSGAGHDAMVMASLCPVAMLFIRCRAGISHNPAEHVEPADAELALGAMLGFIDRLEADVSASQTACAAQGDRP